MAAAPSSYKSYFAFGYILHRRNETFKDKCRLAIRLIVIRRYCLIMLAVHSRCCRNGLWSRVGCLQHLSEIAGSLMRVSEAKSFPS